MTDEKKVLAPARGVRHITLYDRRSSTDRSSERVELKADGTLEISGHDLGQTPKALLGSSDYEYWRKVSAEDMPRVLLGLIQERFASHAEFKDWLEANDIESSFFCWGSSD